MNTAKNQNPQAGLRITPLHQLKYRMTESRSVSPNFELLYVERCEGQAMINASNQQNVKAGLFWNGNNTPMGLTNNAEGYCIYSSMPLQRLIQYDPNLIYHPQFAQLLTGADFIPVGEEAARFLNLLVRTMHKEATNSQLFGDEIVLRYFKIFLVHLLREMDILSQSRNEAVQADIVQRFKASLEKHFTTKKLVTDYAAELYLSPNYLNAVLKKLTGYPASYHIKQRIVLEAKRLGAYTDLCMKQVAYDLGFSDIPHFSKYFKSATGMNFTDFKQEKYLLPMAG